MGLSVRSVLLTIKMINSMSTINRFEEMKTWQEARNLTRLICALSQKDRFRKNDAHCNQTRRAGIFATSNTADSNAAARKAPSARASACEVQSQLHTALDMQYINELEFNTCYEAAASTTRLTSGFIKHL